MSLITQSALMFAVCGFMIPVSAPKLFCIGNKRDKIISALCMSLWVSAVIVAVLGLQQ